VLDLFRRLFKAAGFAALVVVYVSSSFVGQLFISGPYRKRKFTSLLVSTFSIWLLRLLGVRTELETTGSLSWMEKGCLLVSNHMSYLDVLAIASRVPAIFVTSVEVMEAPFLGTLAKMGGSVPVERRHRWNLASESTQLLNLLLHDFKVVLFPEGTSTDGSGILPFKTSFFSLGPASLLPVVPVCVNYEKINGLPMNASFKDSVFYYGDMGFFGQFWNLLGLRSVVIRVNLLEPIETSPSLSRKALAQEVYHRVVKRYKLIV